MKLARTGLSGRLLRGFDACAARVWGRWRSAGRECVTPASTLDLSYDLYVGGISLGKVAMSARFQGNDYKAISSLETKGIVNAFWKAKIETASSGLADRNKLQPNLYNSFSQNRCGSAAARNPDLWSGWPKVRGFRSTLSGQQASCQQKTQKKGTLDPLERRGLPDERVCHCRSRPSPVTPPRRYSMAGAATMSCQIS